MTQVVLPKTDVLKTGQSGTGGLLDLLAKTGRMPPLRLVIKPLEGSNIGSQLGSNAYVIDRFLSYNFSSSILIPVDNFSFAFVAPDGEPLPKVIKEGDIVQLSANDIPIATGLIDSTEVETEADYGEKGSISGRDLLSQLEDQDAISFDSSPIWAENCSIKTALAHLLANTRIPTQNVELRNVTDTNGLLATEPGESKMSALQRFLESFNMLAWMGPTGKLIIGKPTMTRDNVVGDIFLLKAKRLSNVMSIKVTRASATIPNFIVPVWAGQERTVDRVSKEQGVPNGLAGPARLLKLGHRLAKTVVVSVPDATDAQGLAALNKFKAASGNKLAAYAKREMARKNVAAMQVQAVVPGHFNESGDPYITDTCYHVQYDRGNVDEVMYLYHCEYSLTAEQGQRTTLYFCQLGTIVADVGSI